MKLLTVRKLIGVAALVLLLGLSVSSPALGQGRGHGHGRDGFGNFDKKCGKFVNCHDARDGRWDGRGPRRTSVSNGFWTRHHWSRTRRHHDRWNHNGWNHNRENRRH